MKSEIEVKQHILKMLEDLMMGKSGSKFKPKEVEVEVHAEPKEGLAGLLKQASADNPVEEEAEGPMAEEDEEEEDKPRMSLKDFLASK